VAHLDAAKDLARLALTVYALSLLHVAAFAVIGRMLGMAVYEVSFGMGWRLLHFHVLDFPITLRALPLGGFARFEPDDDPDHLESPPGRAFAGFHPLGRVAVYASGGAALLSLSVLLLGGEAMGAFLRGFGQCLGGALSPRSEGRADIALATGLLLQSPRVAVGVLAAKIAAFNLLPMPALNGFDIVRTLVLWKRRPPESLNPWQSVGALLVLALLVGWTVAAAAFVF
jgi:membrane-associated protease RseP (regulator of RpoE activity)